MKGHLLTATALGLLAAAPAVYAPPVHAHVTRVVIGSRQTKAERIKTMIRVPPWRSATGRMTPSWRASARQSRTWLRSGVCCRPTPAQL
jgi:hypothetical protein